MAAKILFVGLATDGPSNIAFQPQSERAFRTLFGASWTERRYLEPTASSVGLSFEPYTLPFNSVNGIKNQLYHPAVSGFYVYFGAVGGSGSQMVDFQYTPYLGERDLIFAGRKYVEQTGIMPYVARLGGVKATLEIGDWKFIAKYAGTKYNLLTVAYDSTGLTITGLEPNYPTLYYDDDIEDIPKLIQRDYDLGLSPLTLQKAGLTLSTFSAALTGGTNGSFTLNDLADFFRTDSVPMDVSHIVLLNPLSSGMIEVVSKYISSRNYQPRLIFIQAPIYTAPTSAWVDDMYNNFPFRHNMIASVVGRVFSRLDGREVERYAVEAAAIGFGAVEGYNLTNVPLRVSSFNPVLSEDELNEVKGVGFIPLMRYIGNDISTYEGVTLGMSNSFLYSSKVAEIVAAAQIYCFDFYGTILAEGPQPQIAKGLRTELDKISFIQIENVSAIVIGDSMVVSVDAFLPDEILTISFEVKNR
jgi:hypothetical protein